MDQPFFTPQNHPLLPAETPIAGGLERNSSQLSHYHDTVGALTSIMSSTPTATLALVLALHLSREKTETNKSKVTYSKS